MYLDRIDTGLDFTLFAPNYLRIAGNILLKAPVLRTQR